MKLVTTPKQSHALLYTVKRTNNPVCEDCGEACERVRLVPEFAFLGCDTCYDGCMALIAAEEAAILAARKRVARAHGAFGGQPELLPVITPRTPGRWIADKIRKAATGHQQAVPFLKVS